jgi:hypothetical protein
LPNIGDHLYGAVEELSYLAPIVYKRGTWLGTNPNGYKWVIYAETTYGEILDKLKEDNWLPH